jgi:hypothetical protein
MRVGILGSGLMGGKLGTIFARAGHEVIFSYSRSEQKLRKLARDAKGKSRPGTPREAAQEADAILLAVHWSRMADALNQAGNLSGKVIVTCSLPMNDDDTELSVAHTSSGAEEAPKWFPGLWLCPPSTLFRAKSFSAYTKPDARRIDRAWCTAATTKGARPWPVN